MLIILLDQGLTPPLGSFISVKCYVYFLVNSIGVHFVALITFTFLNSPLSIGITITLTCRYSIITGGLRV